ncbi:MAG: hypothetical protein AABY22_00940 [Nanoarchaeota archaeon]
MASPDEFVNSGTQALGILPAEIAQNILFLIQLLGGLFVIYLIFLAVRLYFQYRQNKMIKNMKEDVEKIKKKLKIN